MSVPRRLTMGMLFVVMFTISCANQSHIHPASSILRIGWLMTSVERLQARCFTEKRRYCDLFELSMPLRGPWGEARLESATRMTFEEYHLSLLLEAARFCLAAIPNRDPMNSNTIAMWHDQLGNEYLTKYPFSDVPMGCQMNVPLK